MNLIELCKVVPAIPPTAIKDDAAFVSRAIDTAASPGAKSLVWLVALGAIDASMAVLKVMQSDTISDANTLSGTPEEVIDIDDDYTLPGSSDSNKLLVIEVNLQGPHKRYLQLQATAGDGAAGTFMAAIGLFQFVGNPATDLGALLHVKI